MRLGAMLPRRLQSLGPYGLALLLVAAGGMVRWALTLLVGPGLPTFSAFYPFVMLAALVGGWGPGFLATLATALWVGYWQIPPYGQFGLERPVDAVSLVMFCSVGMLISVVAGLFQRTRGRLKELVRERTGQLETAHAQFQAQAGELRAADEQLRESEHLRQLAQEITRVGTFEWNILTGVNTWTPEMEALYGLPPGGFAATLPAWEQLVHPEDRARAVAAVQKAFATSATVEDEWRVVWPDGSIHWLAGRFRILRDEAGQPRALTGINIDITERQQAEAELVRHREHLEELVQERTRQLLVANARLQEQGEELAARAEELRTANEELREREQALRESEERFRALTTASSEVLYRMSPDWSEMRQLHSRAFLANTETPSRTWLAKYIHPDDQPHVIAVIQEAIRTKGVFELEHRVRRADGSLGWTFSRAVPVLDAHGEIVEWFGAASDITARKQAEEALRESEEKFRVMAETSHAAISLYQDGHVVYANRASETIFGYSLDERRRMSLLEFVHPDFQKTARKRMQALLEGSPSGSQNEYKIIRKDGQERWVLTSSSHLTFGGKPAVLASSLDITERKRAEETRRASEEQFRAFFHTAAVGTAQLGLDGRFLDVNDRLCEIVGYSREELLQMGPADLTHPEDRRREEERLSAHLHELTTSYEREKRYIRKDGQVIWVQVTAALIRDAQGKAVRSAGVIQDITERKQAEEAVRQSERQFRSTFENAAIGIAHVALDGHILQFNGRFCEIAGYLPEAIKGKTCEEITFADDWQAEWVQMQQLLEGRVDHYAIEKRYVRADSSPVWVNLTRSIQRDEAGRAEYFIVLVEDISERKRAKEALQERMKELACLYATSRDMQEELSVEELCRRIVAHLVPAMQFPQSAVAVIELNGKRFASENYTEGLSHGLHAPIGVEGEVLGHLWVYHVQERAFLIPEEQNMLDAVAEALSTWLVRQHAEEALHELNAALENKVAERTAELKHRARQLQKLTLDMSETEDRERKRMAEILHDDLQQQLAGAKFHLGLMRHRARYDASLEAIGAQIDHMLKDAIDKSRSLSHELSPMVLHHGDFAETLRWLAHEVQARHGLLVHVRAPGAVRLQSDGLKGFLYRAAQELLFNIVKHAGVSEAEIRVRPCRGYVGLAVSDRGRGFDPQELQETAGFGLLSIRERIELLGGRVKIRSARGEGSTFFIVVPNSETVATGPQAGRKPNGRAQAAEPVAEEDRGRLRVLLADDHEIVREGLRSLLGEEHDVEIVGEAANGREAVDLACRLKPDVIIMDMSMPVIEGADATRQIKACLPETRVIAMSMYEQAEKMEAMYRAGAERYVLKTAPSEELLVAIRGSERA
jgi:PAS domain S-box-containing protein